MQRKYSKLITATLGKATCIALVGAMATGVMVQNIHAEESDNTSENATTVTLVPQEIKEQLEKWAAGINVSANFDGETLIDITGFDLANLDTDTYQELIETFKATEKEGDEETANRLIDVIQKLEDFHNKLVDLNEQVGNVENNDDPEQTDDTKDIQVADDSDSQSQEEAEPQDIPEDQPEKSVADQRKDILKDAISTDEIKELIQALDDNDIFQAIDGLYTSGTLTVDNQSIKNQIADELLLGMAVSNAANDDDYDISDVASQLNDFLQNTWVTVAQLNEHLNKDDISAEVISDEDAAKDLDINDFYIDGGLAGNAIPAEEAQESTSATPSKKDLQLTPIETYLNTLVSKDTRNQLIARQGETPGEFEKNELVNTEDKLIIERRTLEKAENNTADISAINGHMSDIYPGALVYADKNLGNGNPTTIVGLDQAPIDLALNNKGIYRENVPCTKTRVEAAVQDMVQEMLSKGIYPDIKTTYKSSFASSETQMESDLGITGVGDLFGINFKAIQEGKKQTMLVVFKQIYYSVSVSPMAASQIFGKDVTLDDVKDRINEENPGAAQVTNVDFGRVVVVRLDTTMQSKDVEAAWNACIKGTKIDNENKYKDIMSNTSYSVFVYGGGADSTKKLIDTNNLEEVNKILGEDIQYTGKQDASPISYKTNWLDHDRAEATISSATEYIKTTVEGKGKTNLYTDTARGYSYNWQRFYGRRVVGFNDDGSLKLGPWERIKEVSNGGDQDFLADADYVEFGYEFDIFWGTDWPFSGPVWTVSDGFCHKIKFWESGTCRNADFRVFVDGSDNPHIKDTNCASHSRHNWNEYNN